jgi:membrane protein implicated in regulation of membrane protease activity
MMTIHLKNTMKHKLMIFLTIFLPGFVMFGINEIVIGILCFLLQMSFIGWPIASIWAVATLKKYYKKEMHEEQKMHGDKKEMRPMKEKKEEKNEQKN